MSTCHSDCPPASPEPPFLPQELIETIVDFIHDPPTLKACSLVARNLAHISQKNLFSEVVLSPPKFRNTRTTTPAQHFLGILLTSPYIGCYVQTLIIHCEDSVEEQPWLYSDTAVQYILPLLSKLRKISVMGKTNAEDERLPGKASLTWSSLSAALRSALTSVMRSGSVVDLELGGFSRLPTSSVVQCSALKRLSLLPLYLVDDAERAVASTESTPAVVADGELDGSQIQLEDVTIKQTSFALSRTTEWLLRPQCHVTLTKLKNLHFAVSTLEDHRNIAKIMNACSPSLTNLKLNPGPEIHSVRQLLGIAPPIPCNENILSLSSLGELRSLKINTDIRMYMLNNNRFGDSLPWIVKFLETLPSSNALTEFELSIGLHISRGILEKVYWAELVEVLCSERFAGLKSVMFRFPLSPKATLGEGRPPFVKDILEADTHLFELRKRGLLHMDL